MISVKQPSAAKVERCAAAPTTSSRWRSITLARRSQRPPASAIEAPSCRIRSAVWPASPRALAASLIPSAIFSWGTCPASMRRPSQRRPSGALRRRTEDEPRGRLDQIGSKRPQTSARSRRTQGSAPVSSASHAVRQTASSTGSQADSSNPFSGAMLYRSGRIRRTAGTRRSSSSVVVSPWITRAARPDLPLTQ